MRFTINDLEKLQKSGKIKGYHMTATRPGRKKLLQKKGKQHYWIEMNLQAWCEGNGLKLTREYRFLTTRKWRFDWAIPDIMAAIEYNGIFSTKSRHTTHTGYSNDREKINSALADGWRVIEVTPLNYKTMFDYLNKLINGPS